MINDDLKIKAFKLESVNILRKYIGILDFFMCFYKDHIFINLNPYSAWKVKFKLF